MGLSTDRLRAEVALARVARESQSRKSLFASRYGHCLRSALTAAGMTRQLLPTARQPSKKRRRSARSGSITLSPRLARLGATTGFAQAFIGAGRATTAVARHAQLAAQVLQRTRTALYGLAYLTISDGSADANIHERTPVLLRAGNK
jgi:signal transduction histidine kinase